MPSRTAPSLALHLPHPLPSPHSQEQLGFDKAVEECKYLAFATPRQTAFAITPQPLTRLLAPGRCSVTGMSRYAVTPNMLIMPPQVCPAPQQPSSARARG